MRKAVAAFLAAAIIVALESPLGASETINYRYDAQGRLNQVDHSGTVNNGAKAVYQFDNADNRTRLTVTGSVSKVVVVPINGLTVIPIPDP